MKAITLLSGGLDSTVATTMASSETEIVLALTFDYGQKAAPAEIRAAGLTSRALGIPHQVIRLPWLAEICKTALVNPNLAVPTPPLDRLDQLPLTEQSARAVWVPNRNGTFLNIAAGFAESLPCDKIVVGFNAEEGTTFPDNSEPFVEAADRFFGLSTLTHPQILCPTLGWTKREIAREASRRQIPWAHIWPCYLNGAAWCGRCESCARSRRAFRQENIPWPF